MELLRVQLSHHLQVMLNGVIMYLRCVSMTVVHMPEAPTEKTRTISLDTRIRKSSAPTRRHSYAINLQCKTYDWHYTFLTKHCWMVFAHLNVYSVCNRQLQAIMVKRNNCHEILLIKQWSEQQVVPLNHSKGKGEVILLQAQCGPEGG